MRKNLQLQEWLLQKEQREIEVLASESEKRDEMDRDRRRKDEEFRRRAAKQKAKLKRYHVRSYCLIAPHRFPKVHSGLEKCSLQRVEKAFFLVS